MIAARPYRIDGSVCFISSVMILLATAIIAISVISDAGIVSAVIMVWSDLMSSYPTAMIRSRLKTSNNVATSNIRKGGAEILR